MSPDPTPGAPRVVVVGLGPGDADLVTAGTLDRIDAVPVRYLRTRRHPAATVVGDAASFDDVYDAADRLEDVYRTIVDRLLDAARAHGTVLYAVPGSPVVAERTVELLLADPAVTGGEVTVEVHPALSFLDLTWARLGVDPVATGVRLVDGHRFEVEAAGERGPLLVGQCDTVDVLSDVKLAIADALETRSRLGSGQDGPGLLPDDLEVIVLQRLGLPDEHVATVPWAELDRVVEPDHLTSLWIPAYAAPVAREVERFAELVGTLRRECPWDREQTHQSLKRHLLEEAYEVLDAIDGVDEETGEGYDHLEEELGDLLFQVLFHATLAAEAGQFTLADVARTVHDKLYSRHPHVFGAVDADSADQVAANWEQLKKAEKGRASVFEGIPDALPSLLFALKVQKKAAALELGSTAGEGMAGLEGVDALVPLPDLEGAVARARRSPDVEAVGDLLLAAVTVARQAGVDPEMALRSTAIAYRDRVRSIEPD